MASRLKKIMEPILKKECNEAFKRGFEEGKRAGWNERMLAYENQIEFLKSVIKGLDERSVTRFLICNSHEKDITELDLNAPILIQPDTMTMTPIGGRWVPVSERLPEKEKYVLCLKDTGDMWIAEWDYVDDQLWTDHESWCSKDVVTHWMPLPEPPKDGEPC